MKAKEKIQVKAESPLPLEVHGPAAQMWSNSTALRSPVQNSKFMVSLFEEGTGSAVPLADEN